jgi:hypothetical protein
MTPRAQREWERDGPSEPRAARGRRPRRTARGPFELWTTDNPAARRSSVGTGLERLAFHLAAGARPTPERTDEPQTGREEDEDEVERLEAIYHAAKSEQG